MGRWLLVVATVSIGVAADVAAGAWARAYEPIAGGRSEAIAATPDGGFVLAASGSPNALVSIDADGEARAARTLPAKPTATSVGPQGEVFVSLEPGFILKSKPNLDPQWLQRIETEKGALPVASVEATSDGGAIAYGSSFLAKLDATGRHQWSVTLEGADLVAVRETSGRGYLCAGSSATRPWLARLSSSGAIEWQRVYGDVAGVFRAVTALRSGGLVAVGASARQALVVRTNAGGEPERAYMTTLDSPGYGAVETAGGSLAVFGLGGEATVLAFALDGSIRWQRTLHERNEVAEQSAPLTRRIARAADGVVIALPLLPQVNKTRGAARLYKMNDAGESDCTAVRSGGGSFVAVELSSSAGAARPLPLEVRVARSSFQTEPIEVAAVAQSCHSTAEVHAPLSPFRVRDREQLRNDGARYRALLWARNFDALDQIAAQVRGRRFADPMRPHDELHRFYAAFIQGDEEEAELIALLRDWQKARPQSIAAPIALAHTLFRVAWIRRGGDYADTVTDLGWTEYYRFLDQAAAVLIELKDRGHSDPHYWNLLVRVSHERGTADVRDIARRALKIHADPSIAFDAATYLLPKWGGSPQKFVAFADEAARLTRATLGDAVYWYLAYRASREALNGKTDEEAEAEFAAYAFDWKRVRDGGKAAIAMAPEWPPSYHRLALLADLFKDRETAAELFATKYLAYYDGALTIWRNSGRYDRVKEWALPKKERVASKPTVAVKPAPPPAPAAVLPPQPRRPRADFVSLAPDRWPQILLQTRLTAAGVTHDRIAAFLVETAKGVVAVSAVPPMNGRLDRDNVIGILRGQFGSWTVSPPTEPKRVLAVKSFLTVEPPNPQMGVALAVDVSGRRPPAQPLKVRRFDAMSELSPPLYVVGCRWTDGTCAQAVYEGRVAGMSLTKLHALRTIQVGVVADVVNPESFSGAAVLDSDGYVIAVATRAGVGWRGYKAIVNADVLDTVLP